MCGGGFLVRCFVGTFLVLTLRLRVAGGWGNLTVMSVRVGVLLQEGVVVRNLLVSVVAALALTVAAGAVAARAPVVFYMDDGGSGRPSIGDRCWHPGAVAGVYNPLTGDVVTAICELGPGGVVAIWVVA